MENEITAICQKCGDQFKYVLKPGYPRKYCETCKAIKGAEYEAKKVQYANKTQPDVPVVKVGEIPPHITIPDEPQVAKSVVLNRTEKPHSYEFGAAGQRHKVYYNETMELLQHMANLKAAGLLADEEKGFE